MLRNYFRIAWRNLTRNKLFSLLNLIGLSTGLTGVFLIYLWVNDELNTDKFNENDSQLYEVRKKMVDDNGVFHILNFTQGTLAQSLATELPEVEYAVQLRKDKGNGILSVNDKFIRVKHEFAGRDFFKVFSYPMIVGNSPELSGVSDIYLSDQLALKLFNSTDILGKTVSWNYRDGDIDFSGPYRVAGVFKSPPANASNQFDILSPFELYAQKHAGGMGDINFWGSNMVTTYIVLKQGTDIGAFNSKVKDFSKAKIKSLYAENQELLKYEGELFVQKYSDAYLFNNYVDGKQVGGRIEYVKLFSFIAFFILLIACINFMNLSTAKAAKRMKEIGILKVVGAPRGTLILQHMSEAILSSFVSMLLAFLFTFLLLPAFREITDKNLTINFDADFILPALIITVLTGIVAGTYPALYLSGFKTISVLRGQFMKSASETAVRKGLVIIQFVISTILIISVLVIYQQMKLIQTKNLGYDKENIVRFSNDGVLPDQTEIFISELKNIPGVIEAAGMRGDFFGHPGHGGGGITWMGKDPNLSIQYYGVSGDYHFVDLLKLKIIAGRTFSPKYGIDNYSVIFNESAIAVMGIHEPIGKEVSLWGQKKKIIGIVKDFYFESLYKKIGPAFLEYTPNSEFFLIKLNRGSENAALSSIEKVYKKFISDFPLEFKFLDKEYQAIYSSETKVSLLTRYFAILAILLSCLGLFGLAVFTAEKRLKEIGIRKVIGASVFDVVKLLSQDFLILVCVSFLISFPISWWALNRWLGAFAYRIDLSAGVFLMTSITILMFVIITVSFQAFRSAVLNPIHILRSE